jgi:hypothetical protein
VARFASPAILSAASVSSTTATTVNAARNVSEVFFLIMAETSFFVVSALA